MNRTVKKILKILLIMLCAFIVFEICGAIINIKYAQAQTQKVLEIAENNGGDVWDSYSDIYYSDLYMQLFSGTFVIVYSENIDLISSSLDEKIPDDVAIYPLKLVGCTDVGVPSYAPYWDKIDFETNHDKENYYVIDVGDNAPFKHNIINYIIFRISFKDFL
ncbi:MAG: hypothetical protein K2J76_02870 [Oscillospiraceae bacterium]|nr:hypothetical protein [Oscillospiraceae bacterium]